MPWSWCQTDWNVTHSRARANPQRDISKEPRWLQKQHVNTHAYTCTHKVTEFIDRSLSEGLLTSSSSPAFLFPSVPGPPGKTWKHLSVSHAANLNGPSLCMSKIPQTFDSCDANQMLRNLIKPVVLNILSALTSLSALTKQNLSNWGRRKQTAE